MKCLIQSKNHVASYYYPCLGGKGLLPLLCPGKTQIMPRDAFRFSAGLCFVCGDLPDFT